METSLRGAEGDVAISRVVALPAARDPDIRQDDYTNVMLNLFQHLAQPAPVQSNTKDTSKGAFQKGARYFAIIGLITHKNREY